METSSLRTGALGLALALGLTGCATRSADVAPVAANPADFALWSCGRIDDELDAVRQRATDVAYAVDERAGNNILALSLGVTLFWPAILAMRPAGPEAAELGRLKGRDEALRVAAQTQACPPSGSIVTAERAASYPLVPGERMVFDDRANPRQPGQEWVLELVRIRRNQVDFELALPSGRVGLWQQDQAGNVTTAPPGSLQWPRLLRGGLELGQVLAGDIQVAGDPLERARVRGQVVAIGPQLVGPKRFDAAVIELFGDAPRGRTYTTVRGAMVVDRASGLLLRLDLGSGNPNFAVQRRLLRVEGAPPSPSSTLPSPSPSPSPLPLSPASPRP